MRTANACRRFAANRAAFQMLVACIRAEESCLTRARWRRLQSLKTRLPAWRGSPGASCPRQSTRKMWLIVVPAVA